jgi:two-component system LytT family response regulator
MVKILVHRATGHFIVDATEVDWIAADNYYAALHAAGKRHLVRESLTSLASRLGPLDFVRVHRSAIVNARRVREVRNGSDLTTVVLYDGTVLQVSRRRRASLAAALRRMASAVASSSP